MLANLWKWMKPEKDQVFANTLLIGKSSEESNVIGVPIMDQSDHTAGKNPFFQGPSVVPE